MSIRRTAPKPNTSRKAFVRKFGLTEPIRAGHGLVTESFARNGMWTAWQAGAAWSRRQINRDLAEVKNRLKAVEKIAAMRRRQKRQA